VINNVDVDLASRHLQSTAQRLTYDTHCSAAL